MDEGLRTLLADCERRANFPVAARLLGDVIQQLVAQLPPDDRAQDGSLPTPVLQQFPLAEQALRLINLGLTPSRVQLRELAELEHYIEIFVRTAPERQKRREILARVTGGPAPPTGQKKLATNSAGPNMLLMRYGFALATVLLAFLGVANLPTAVAWGDVAWAMAGSCLALSALFAYCWWKIRPQ